MTLQEQVARSGRSEGEMNDPIEWWEMELANAAIAVVLKAMMEPTPQAVAKVVQEADFPTDKQWEVGKLATFLLGVVSVSEEASCAELVRDWQAMLTAFASENNVEVGE